MSAPIRFLRSLATIATIPVCFAYGMVVLAAFRDRRRAVNAMLRAWVPMASFTAGARFVIEHEERIDAARPAVYVFNHQSAADLLILGRVLKRDFTGVAKIELRRHPILGTPLALVGAVFVDRADRERAIEALRPVSETIRGGVSVCVAPEGTRVEAGRVGAFKKGAFRLAMAAGVPVVPMVFHNAVDLLPRRSLLVRPATLRVTVHPPIPTDGWRLEDLDERIAEVRRIYVESRPGEGGGDAGAGVPGRRPL